jgi:hypothetical protein
VHRLYQWLSERASFFRAEESGRGISRTVRTEVTVERQGVTVMFNAAGATAGFDHCPLCGKELTPAQAEPDSFPRQKGSIAQAQGEVERPPR